MIVFCFAPPDSMSRFIFFVPSHYIDPCGRLIDEYPLPPPKTKCQFKTSFSIASLKLKPILKC